MNSYHKPTALQTAKMTFTASDAFPDMRNAASAVFNLRNPDGTITTLTTTKGAATADAVIFEHAWNPTAGEAQTVGQYSLWATITSTQTGTISTNPYSFCIVEDFETATN